MIDKLSTTVRQLIQVTTEDELSHAIAARLDQLIDADQTAVIPADQCTGGPQGRSATDYLNIPGQQLLISGIIGQSFANGESWIIDDLMETRSTSTQSKPIDPLRYRSLLCVPVPQWGALVALSHDPLAFSAEDLESVEFLRTFVGPAVDRITSSDVDQGTDERLEKIACILSHDLRGPLAVANGRLELAREEHDSEHLEQVATSHARLEELIDGVATLARTGEEVDATEHVDIQESAERAWKVVETAEAELTVEATRTILADKSCLCQIFENLFRNAISHGDAKTTVWVGLLDDRTGFYVADDGPGIPTEERATIFDHGYSNGNQGEGLGLFIVQNIVDAHGWEITATDSAHDGARLELSGIETV